MCSDASLVRRHGYAHPDGPGIYEIVYMGRRMKVHVNRDVAGDLVVFGVPGHLEEGMPITDFDGFSKVRIDDSRRSAASNLNVYDRASSRAIAGLTALRAAVSEDTYTKERLASEIGILYVAVSDREGVEKAVAERVGVWYIEDRDGIPLPSYGLGAPPEGKDVNGRDLS